MAWIVKFKLGNGKWITNENPQQTEAAAKRLAAYMKRNEIGPKGENLYVSTKITKVDMRKADSLKMMQNAKTENLRNRNKRR